jgi:glutathione S-transferase
LFGGFKWVSFDEKEHLTPYAAIRAWHSKMEALPSFVPMAIN